MSGNVRRRQSGPSYNEAGNLEAGDAGNRPRSASVWTAKGGEELDEYTALNRYISTYRDVRQDDDDDAKKRPRKKWWQFWKSKPPVTQQSDSDRHNTPDTLLETELQQGLSSSEVTDRRKVFGWNELTAESENMFAKFLGFFTGPILYGTLSPSSRTWRVSAHSIL